MGAKAGAETDEPKIATGGGGGGGAEGFFEGEKHGGAAHVAKIAEDAGTGVEGVRGDDGCEGIQDVAAAGMGDDAGDGARAAGRPKFRNGGRRELGHGAVEEVAQFAVAVFEAEFVAIGGPMERLKIKRAETGGPGRGTPEGGGGTVGKKTGADNHAGVVIEKEDGRADFDGDAGDGGAGLRGEHVTRGPQRGNRGAATETDEILENRIGAQAELFGNVTGESRAEVTGAGADEQGVEVRGFEVGLGERGSESAGGKCGAFGAEDRVQFVGAPVEDFFDVGRGEVSGRDTVVAAQNTVQNQS